MSTEATTRIATLRAQRAEHTSKVIPAARAGILSAQADYQAALLTADATEIARLQAAVAAQEAMARLEEDRLGALERALDAALADEKTQRRLAAIPGAQRAARDYIEAAALYHDHMAGLVECVKRAETAIEKIRTARQAGVAPDLDINALVPPVNSVMRPQPAPFGRLLTTPDHARQLLNEVL